MCSVNEQKQVHSVNYSTDQVSKKVFINIMGAETFSQLVGMTSCISELL